jgi:hypothetical protein
VHRTHWKDRSDCRFAALLASQVGASQQSPSTTKAAYPFSQQEQLGAQHVGSFAALASQGLARLRAVRQLVRFRTLDQICSPPGVARASSGTGGILTFE